MTSMPAAIALQGLTKRFGPDRGVFDVGFEVQEGAIFGFLGPNGAGKTTLIRLMLAYLRPDAGRATVLGLDAQRDPVAIRRRLGYVPAELKLDEEGTALALLKYLAGYRPPGALARAKELAERLELRLDGRIKTYSKGMKQKVALIQAMMHDPELLILDEPTEGLDPLMQHALHELLREAAGRGRTVFFSSHQLAEVDVLCDAVAIIGRGKLLAHEDVATLRSRRRRILRIVLTEPVTPAIPGGTLVRQDGLVATFHYTGEAAGLLQALAGLPLADFTLEPAPLEETFLEYYK
ncbi:MAG: transporter related protein [Cyanobacteria bacterium RYN_339]|nr:transporter related protein [Cyanobacteria bacterium RYN_339]